MSFDAAIIGGGISGLATAEELRRRGRSVVLLERQVAAGGKAFSERLGGFLMEHGPSTVGAHVAAATDWSQRLELETERCELGPTVRRRYLVAGGRLEGMASHPFSLLSSGYLSLPARLRLLAEVVLPRGREGDDESVAQFARRRFGREVAERLVDPLVGGIYAGRADEISLRAAFPALHELERQYRSVVLGVAARRWRGGRMPGGRLFSWRHGVASLPRALQRNLGQALRTGIAVQGLERGRRGFRLLTPEGELEARAVVIATQPHMTAALIEKLDPTAAEAAAGVAAPPLAVVYLGYRRQQVEHALDGLGFLAAADEGRALNGAQFCSTMFSHRAPAGHVALAAYFGGARNPDLGLLPADDLVALARREFGDLVGARGEPVLARVRHWPRGLPQYAAGHVERVRDLAALPQRLPGLFLTGNYFRGPSVAACLELADETAARLDGFLAGLGESSDRAPIKAAASR
ncbi:MAG TPA: protoporphyrinogen oxidase [Alphaproteobacteria bacterium]|nr:protoporphyrinogen oxidase [Alphaproteobacteria bacterium]HJM50119.1 protoporphyrinogen oxidase [Alphaproteobacteria bacterium]